jgi:hypothetical protein
MAVASALSLQDQNSWTGAMVMRNDGVKRKLAVELDKLPAKDIPKVLDFVEKLKAEQQRKSLSSLPRKKRDPMKNPLRGLLGIADVQAFAHRIDEELYG